MYRFGCSMSRLSLGVAVLVLLFVNLQNLFLLSKENDDAVIGSPPNPEPPHPSQSVPAPTKPPFCTETQLKKINNIFPNRGKRCSHNKYPWTNKCPISAITGCPDTAWLDRHYHHHHHHPERNFLAINVGCNKGFDAVNLLRMGSSDATISREVWRAAMPAMSEGVCHQESAESQYAVREDASARMARVYCIEPMPRTYRALQMAANQTGYDQRGLSVRKYAMNNEEPGTVLFPKATDVEIGAEKKGATDCYSKFEARQTRLQKSCEAVNTTRLDMFVQSEGLSNDIVDVLLIDVEGWDHEVLKGGTHTLKRTAYLEFEFNWKGPWFEERIRNHCSVL